MSPTRGLWGSRDAGASYFGLRVGEGPRFDRPDERRTCRRRRTGCRAGARLRAVVSGRRTRRRCQDRGGARRGTPGVDAPTRCLSRTGGCGPSAGSHRRGTPCSGTRARSRSDRSLCSYPDRRPADRRSALAGSAMRTETWMSITGFAARPGTEVEPTWSMRTTMFAERVADAVRLFVRTTPATQGRSRPIRTRACDHASPRASRGIRATWTPARTRRRSPAAPGRRRPCPPDAIGRRASTRPGTGRRRPARAPRPARLAPSRRHEPFADPVDPLMMVGRAREHADSDGREEPAPGAGFTSCVEIVSATGTPCSSIPGMSGRC